MRNAASCCQPLVRSLVPRGARMTSLCGPAIKVSIANPLCQAFDISCDDPVLFEPGDERAYKLACPLDLRRGLERMAVFQSLCRGHQLNGQDLLRVLDNLLQLERGGHAHGYMIFLTSGSGQTIHARW